MKNHVTNVGAALVLFSTLWGASAFAQKNADTIDTHLVVARTAAGAVTSAVILGACNWHAGQGQDAADPQNRWFHVHQPRVRGSAQRLDDSPAKEGARFIEI